MQPAYLKLKHMQQAVKYPQFVYGFNARGGGYWEKLFWLMMERRR